MIPPRIAELAAEVGGEREFNYTVHVWLDPAFVFFSNPICACSTLKASLNLSVARARGIDFRIDDPATIHNRQKNILLTPKQVGYDRFLEILDDPGTPVFAFVRDPVSRFRSAYIKKLARETQFTRRVLDHLSRRRPGAWTAMPDIEAFAALVAADPALRDLDEHWRLQRRQIFLDLVPRLRLGLVEAFARDAAAIFGGIFGAEGYVLFDAVQINPANASASRRNLTTLGEAALAQLAKAYAPDYDMLVRLRAARTAAPGLRGEP